MFRYLIIIIGLLLLMPLEVRADTVSSALISSIQSQFQGQVVGVSDMEDGTTAKVQVLLSSGQVIVVTVDKSSNSIVNVKR